MNLHSRSIIAVTANVVALILPKTDAALEIIGSGYGRTGTDTTREALTMLGYKTYHMREIIDNQLLSHVEVWKEAAETNCANIDSIKSIFEEGGFTAAVDYPEAMCWEQLSKAYPDAKVLHTQRESTEKWWDSASNTILIVHTKFPVSVFNAIFPFWNAHHAMSNAMWSNMLKRHVKDSDDGWPDVYKEELLARYESNNARVREVVDESRLLVQDHKDGWTKLCTFLGKDVPNVPYPHSNTRAQFRAFFRNLELFVGCAVLVAFVVVVYLTKRVLTVIYKGEGVNKKKAKGE